MLKAYVFVLSYHAFHKKTTLPIFSNKYAEFKWFIWFAPLPSHSRDALWFAYDSGLTGQLPSCHVTGPGPSAHGRSYQGKCTLGSAAQRMNDLGLKNWGLWLKLELCFCHLWFQRILICTERNWGAGISFTMKWHSIFDKLTQSILLLWEWQK